jgi:hypothetical protein
MKLPRRLICGCLFTGAAVFCVLAAAVTYLAVNAAPVREWSDSEGQPLGQSLGYDLPADSKVRAMVRRAQLDYVVNPVPFVGRTLLYIDEVRSDGKTFEFVFYPLGKLDIFVIYRFSSDGRMLWKRANS